MKFIFSRAFLCLSLIFLLLSCTKESDELTDATESLEKRSRTDLRSMTLSDAQALYEANEKLIQEPLFFDEDVNTPCNVLTPIWSMAREGKTKDDVDLVVVPVRHEQANIPEGSGAQLVFFGYNGCDLPVELMYYESSDPANKKNNLCEFTGGLINVNFCDCSQYGFGIEDGVITKVFDTPVNTFEQCSANANEDGTIVTRDDKTPCPKWGKSWWSKFGDWFSGLFNGSGSTGTTTIVWISGNGGWNGFRFGFPNYGEDPPTDESGRPTLKDQFDFNIFSGEGQKALNRLNEIISEHDLVMCTSTLHNLLFQCISSNNPNPGSCGVLIPEGDDNDPTTQEEYEIEIYDYIEALEELEGSDACLSSIVAMYSDATVDMEGDDGLLMCFIEESNEFDIEDDELLELIKNECNGNNECEKKKFDCLGKLTAFQEEYDITFSSEDISLLAFSDIYDVCDLDGEEFGSEVLGAFLHIDENHKDEVDPDFTIDCISFAFIPVGSDLHYQSCGVTGIDIDFVYTCPNPHGWGFLKAKISKVIYFEVPHIRENPDGTTYTVTPLEASALCAEAVTVAEEAMEIQYEFSCPATHGSSLLLSSFITHLNTTLVPFGARATLHSNYGVVPIRPASYYSTGMGPCF